MEINSTRKKTFLLAILLLGLLQLVTSQGVFAQVPTYTIDLTGKPNGYWDSPSVRRGGTACESDNCVQFNVILDKDAAQLELDMIAGSEPKGSMFYRLNCGTEIPVGQPICIPNSGTITLTLCKPGNNSNVYRIKSIAAFEPQVDISVTGGCTGILKAPIAFDESSIVWEDLTGGGVYMRYLTFPNGNKEAYVTPDDNAPEYVDYRVRGTSLEYSCTAKIYYDDVRVYFFPKPVVTIGPEPAIICPGGTGVVLRGTVTGGDGEFDYFWYGPNNTRVGSNSPTYTATAIGTYKLSVVPRSTTNINCQEFSATVEVVTNLTANAGPDQLICSSGTVQLAGAITAATGGIWSTSGSGTFSSNTALNAVYTPSAADISAGSVRLRLTSTGNGNCTAVSDEVLITFYNMQVTLTGTPVICNGTLGTISASVTGAQGAVTYRWSSGETTASINNKAAGTYSVTVTDSKGCSLAQSFTITQVTGPSDFTASVRNTSCGLANGEIRVTGTTGGTASYTYSKDGTNFQTSSTFTGLAAGAHTITVKDANGCTFAKSFTLTNLAGPTAVSASSTPASCLNNDGAITAGTVTGGTAPYTYSINGTTFQSGTTFTGVASGSYTLTAKDASGCTVTAAVSVTQATLTNFTATAASSTCGNSNGSVTVSAVQGGIAPYTYSKNGTTFQSSATLTDLAAGTHTITVKDAKGCTFAKQVAVTNVAGPTNFATTLKPTTCGASNGEIAVTGTTGGTAPYTYSKDGVNFQTAATFTGLATGSHTITVKDANGCTFARTFTLTNVAGPAAVAATAQSASCFNNDGGITAGTVTGGTAPYTYSINGTTFQSGTTFTGIASGSYTLTAKDANGCTITASVTVEKTTPTGFTATPASSTCGGANGSIVVSNVVGGVSPYTYSKDGTTFQASATLTGLAAGTHTITVKDAKGCTFAKQVTLEDVAGPSNMSLTAASSTCGASNGTITVGAVTGGVAPYTYSRNGSTFQSGTNFTGLAAGNYTITVKDANGCSFARQVTVANVAGPTDMAASAQASTCGASNGEIRITGTTGGMAPYTYSKDGVNFQASATLTGFAAGSHTITVKDANGCTFGKAFTVTNVAGPTAVTATSTPASCLDNDGAITAGTVTGGTAPYTYSINGTTFQSGTTFTGVASGSYTLTAKDANGCTVTGTVTVAQNVPSNFASTTTASTCGRSDGSITIGTVTGGLAPYTFSVDNGSYQSSATFNGLAAGAHTIRVKDARGCVFAKDVAVNNIAGPTFTASTQASSCGANNGRITVSGVTGGVSPYTYSKDGVAFQSTTAFDNVVAGEYTISVKDANGCIGTRTVVVEDVAGPSDLKLAGVASTCGSSNARITISEVTGGTAPYTYSKDGTTFQSSATFASLAAGEHTITVKDARGCTFAKKIIVENIPGPSEMALTSTSSTCGSANGIINVTGVTGGTAPYSYTINGNTYQAGTRFEAVLAGTHTVTVKDANGCTLSKEIVVGNIAGPTDLAATTKASTCSGRNGELTVTGVTGGKAPYAYSKDGVNFQATATFTELLAGNHTITVKDANGCTFAKNFTVTNIAGPATLAASSQAATCADNDGRIMAGTVTGGTAPYTYSLDGTSFQSGTTFTSLASGEYTLTVKDANGCKTTTTVRVDKDGPGDFAASTSSSTCGGENGSIRVTSVVGGAAPYTYSLNTGAFQSSASFTGLVAGTYTVTVKDANGCMHTESIVVTDQAGPSNLTASAQSTTCGNSNGQISVSGVTGGRAPYTYSINGTNFQAATGFTGLTAGEYLVTVKDANGCTFAKAVTVTNAEGPEGFALEARTATCGASNGSVLVGAVTGGRAPYTYSKDGVTFQASTTLTGLAAGNQTITVKDANGCTFSKAVVIGNIAGPAGFELAATTATCGQANGSITASGVTGGTAPYTYALNGGNFQSSTAFASVAPGEHTITVKDANGCTLDKKIVVGNVAGPSALTASTTPASCKVNDGAITVTQVIGGTAPYTYSMDNTRFQATGNFGSLAPGEYEVYVKDANGCSTTTSVTVGTKGPQEAALTAAKASCGETNGSITVTSVTGGTAPFAYSINGTTFQSAATFANLAAGTYEVTIKDAEGCTLTVSHNVVNNGGVESFTATGTDASCGERNGRIAISGIVGGQSPYTYSIDGTNYTSEPTFTGLAEGDYQVHVKDASGCMMIQTLTLTNSPALTDVKFRVTAASCGDNSGQVVVDVVTGGTAPYTYSLDGTNFSGSATLSNVAPGSYTLIVKDAKGCTFSVPVAVSGMNSKLSSVRHISCFGETNGVITISATGKDANTEYSIDNGKTFQKDSVFTGLAKGTYQLITRFSSTCSITIGAVEVKEPALLQAEVTPANGVMGVPNSGSAAVTAISGGTAPYTYSLNNGLFTADSVFKDLRGGEHFLVVKDANGCTTEVSFRLESLGELDIPNGFTPNGDGINDRWVIRNLPEMYPACKVTVYNRWGSPVFESKGYNTPWDGTHKGKRLPDGTYYAIIEFGDSKPAVKTSVTIMR